ncbi:S-DNA-T family DNA segregation ATPase FtsK/SpoIIIE [Prosthecobacter fusiformis]|uniref:S-DNA-T family DNA segregation ATPase FtsK/SpoIIIE n=1 Tax=Prosthecobacter fusiformis TaxID=48464 RepID=A0A4R7S350_9BACT|nr:DNA translocase FtsK [Prosthecobacter fusiformis]TDU71467.1 S-DNA-T family DNA segregation ATPase FtsK/SpoIIIE [Prosthecobacter fusiformis]
MAAELAKNRPARARVQEKESPWNDAVGIAMLVLAAMYLLALVSYDPRDLPAWSHLSPTDQPSVVTHNFIGRMGALLAGYSLFLAGMATYLVPFSVTWFGVCKLASNVKVTGRSWLGVALMVITTAAIFEVQDVLNQRDDITPLGGGGGLGYVIGGSILANLLGKVGSTVFLAGIYAVGFFLASGIHPLQALQAIRQEITQAWETYQIRREIAARETEFDGNPTAVSAPTRRRKTSSSEIKAETTPPGPLVTPELGLTFEPAKPKIIDSSASRSHSDTPDKPRLSEVWEKKRAQKLEQAPHGTLGNLAVRFKDYKLPELDLLSWPDESLHKPTDTRELLAVQDTIIKALASFNVKVEAGDITRGPAITRYEVRPVDGLRVARIAALDDDIARATCAERINILAPIPGKDTVGIELANRDKVIVPIRELLEDEVFSNGKAKLPIALGKDVYGKTIIGDLAAMPHLLVAGATGSGKSVCINGIITSLLCRFAPDELRFIMIDPKVVEMQNYAELPHLAVPVVTDPKKALLALRWVVREMESRYQMFAQEACRNFETFNNRNRKRAAANEAKKAAAAAEAAANPVPEASAKPARAAVTSAGKDDVRVSSAFARAAAAADHLVDGTTAPWDDPEVAKELESETLPVELPVDHNGDWVGDSQPPRPKARSQEFIIPDTLPYIVVIIDELADLMQTAPADIEVAIARITQMARAAGIHLIVATQTPRADVITGVIKANIPTRIAFQVSSALDSRVILDRKGAENLVGKGDMLYVPPGGAQPIRSQGALVTDDEIHAVVERCVAQGKPIFDVKVDDETGEMGDDEDEDGSGVSSEEEDTLEKCLEVIRQEKKASTSLFQRRLKLGYGRAARMMDILEDRGIIGPGEGAKPREILVDMDMI